MILESKRDLRIKIVEKSVIDKMGFLFNESILDFPEGGYSCMSGIQLDRPHPNSRLHALRSCSLFDVLLYFSGVLSFASRK